MQVLLGVVTIAGILQNNGFGNHSAVFFCLAIVVIDTIKMPFLADEKYDNARAHDRLQYP